MHDSEGRISLIHLAFLASPVIPASQYGSARAHGSQPEPGKVDSSRQTLPGNSWGAPNNDAGAYSTQGSSYVSPSPTAISDCMLVIKAARNLPHAPNAQVYDTFATVTCRGVGSFRTLTVAQSLFPVYSQSLPIPLPQPGVDPGINVSVYRANASSAPELIGASSVCAHSQACACVRLVRLSSVDFPNTCGSCSGSCVPCGQPHLTFAVSLYTYGVVYSPW